jgi:hypothetical protein
MSERVARATEGEHSQPSAVLERLSWQLARRDDQRVAQGLYAGEAIEEMHETPVRPVCWTSFLCSLRRSG